MSWTTLWRVLAMALVVWVALRLRVIFVVSLVAVLLAVTLEPVAAWAERKRVGRGITALVIGALVLGSVATFVAWLLPDVMTQARTLGETVQHARQQLSQQLPAEVLQFLQRATSSGSAGQAEATAARAATAAAAALTTAVFAFVLSLYLLVEGQRTYVWLLAFVPARHRRRADATAREAQRLVRAYVAGNIITSAVAAAFVFVVLLLLKVPAALVMGVLAGIFDLIPVLGFIVFIAVAVLLAATVSGTAALTVAMAYSGYHLFENYYLVPRVYGDQLRLSNVAVLLAFAAGAELGGVIGALVALPIAAAYPAVERLWLRDRLPDDTVTVHAAIEGQPAKAGDGSG